VQYSTYISAPSALAGLPVIHYTNLHTDIDFSAVKSTEASFQAVIKNYGYTQDRYEQLTTVRSFKCKNFTTAKLTGT